MKEQILEALSNIELEHNVEILYACESGSRAWGFASPDSDFDVRFIYRHKPDWYVSIDERRDVIELPVDDLLDVNGWDIKKALKLLRSSNAPLYEWLQSPILYKSSDFFLPEMRPLMSYCFSLRAGLHHYISMGYNTFADHLNREHVRLKKYFYALRPLLAAMWIRDKQELPPMEFHVLRGILNNDEINKEIDSLLEQKTKASEKDEIPPVSILQRFIEEELGSLNEYASTVPKHQVDSARLDQTLRKFINDHR